MLCEELKDYICIQYEFVFNSNYPRYNITNKSVKFFVLINSLMNSKITKSKDGNYNSIHKKKEMILYFSYVLFVVVH